jgi:hypothetical protein
LANQHIYVHIRPSLNQRWCNFILRTGICYLHFRSPDDLTKFEALPLTERPFLVKHQLAKNQDARTVTAKGAEMNTSTDLCQWKLDILFLPASFNVATLSRLLTEMNVTPIGLIKHLNPKGKGCKVNIGFHEDGYMLAMSRELHNKYRPESKSAGVLKCSVNWTVPFGHCFRCFSEDETPERSKGHVVR